MATDLKIGTDQSESALARPSLKIVGLHIRGLKSIGSLDLPEDGLGWDGPIPDFVMLGGINGSGKTTILEFLAAAFEHMEVDGGHFLQLPTVLRASEARIDFEFALPGRDAFIIRFLVGDEAYIRANASQDCLGLQYDKTATGAFAATVGQRVGRLGLFCSYIRSNIDVKSHAEIFGDGPVVVYFLTERRTLFSPPTNHKVPGKLPDHFRFVDRWEPPEKWDDSLEARLYGVRWADLNAKEAGWPEAASRFRSYQLAFDRFFEGRKQIKWTPQGELIVETKGGAVHDLSELSSGEKQVILFTGELLHRWRPGALILIDEPELHLHESYQTKLWEALVAWQKERGGQVIVTTQSGHLFQISDPGIKVLLSARRAR